MNNVITIITPTLPDRSGLLDRCISFVRQQRDKCNFEIEHIILSDTHRSIGQKLNAGVMEAAGDIIVRFDDDDIYRPEYVKTAVSVLTSSGADIAGVKTAYMYRAGDGRMWFYDYRGSQPYVMGSGSCFWRHRAILNPYPNSSYGEDALFCAGIGRVAYIPDCAKLMLISLHDKNTASGDNLHTIPEVSSGIIKDTVKSSFGLD